jgi:hypothetical protein
MEIWSSASLTRKLVDKLDGVCDRHCVDTLGQWTFRTVKTFTILLVHRFCCGVLLNYMGRGFGRECLVCLWTANLLLAAATASLACACDQNMREWLKLTKS